MATLLSKLKFARWHVVALLSASNNKFSETGGMAKFLLTTLHTVAQDTKLSEPSQGYYKRKGRPRQLVR